MHLGAPVLQLISPRLHASPTEQSWPAVHATHVPEPLQTPIEHATPAAFGEAWHTRMVPWQTYSPWVHSLPVLQLPPGVQVTQVPEPLQVPLTPATVQVVPAARFCVKVHSAAPLAQLVKSPTHSDWLPHIAPCVQALHVPEPLQTPPLHAVPAADAVLAGQSRAFPGQRALT
jgi:hypothetical protein